jgi:molecular chaperone Hsp33
MNVMQDQLVRLLSSDGSIRAIAVSTSRLAGQICQLQNTDPTATVALGRVISAAALLGGLLKGSQRVALSIEANGPVQKLQAESDAQGTVRASIKQPQCNLPPNEDGFDVANAIGKAGFLHVVKDLGLKEPYRGCVQLVTSEVAEDLANYFVVSEQVPTAVGLGVTLDSQAAVATSGGFLIQAMPGCRDQVLGQIEEALQHMLPVSSQLQAGQTPLQILEQVLRDIPFTVQTEYALEFRCNCNRQYVSDMLTGLPDAELTAMVQQQQDTVVTCEYCKKKYTYVAAEIEKMLHL